MKKKLNENEETKSNSFSQSILKFVHNIIASLLKIKKKKKNI